MIENDTNVTVLVVVFGYVFSSMIFLFQSVKCYCVKEYT